MLMLTALSGFGGGDPPPMYRYMRLALPGVGTGYTMYEFAALYGGIEYPLQAMTSNTTPPPLLATGIDDESHTVWRVFSRSGVPWTPNAIAGAMVTLDFGSVSLPKPTAFSLLFNMLNAPSSVTIRASVDATTWDTLINVAGLTWDNSRKIFMVT